MAEKKRVLVLVRHPPLGSLRDAEALRQAVGLTLAENEVTALLLDAAAWLALPISPQLIGGGEVRKHIDTLLLLKGKVKVERESLERWGLKKGEVIRGIEVISSQEALSEIEAAEAVISF